jgi:hypothetical protein
MPPFVRREHVQAGRQAESNAADERIRETHTRQIDVGEITQERADFVVGTQELRHRIGERGSLPWLNLLWRLALEPRLHRRFERSNEQAPEPSGAGRTATPTSVC